MNLYFIALLLPSDINATVQALKKQMQEKWGCTIGLKSPAHITFIPPFRMQKTMEQALQRALDLWCEPVALFEVALKDFSAFKPRTIFITPLPHGHLKKLKVYVDAFCVAHPQFGAVPDRRPFQPHVTIATRDLSKEAFAEAWAFFETQTFNAVFMATGLSLLRHNGHTWDVVHTAPFGR